MAKVNGNYEVLYVINPTLGEEDTAALVARFKELAEMRALVDRERARLCAELGPVRRLAFRYLWGKPPGDGNRKNTENPPETGG